MFVLLDDVLCSNKEERRNVIKSSNGTITLAIPLLNKKALIKDIEMNNQLDWKHRHIASMQGCYQKTDYWDTIAPSLVDIYSNSSPKLVDFNIAIMEFLRDYLDIKTPLVRSSELIGISGEKNMKIISICKTLGATTYLSGLGAKNYMDEEAYRKNNIKVVYQQFTHPVYPQRWGPFVKNLSIVDLLFHWGPTAKQYMEKQIIY